MGTTYFLSDVHLGGDAPAVEASKERDLISFLGRISGDDRLFLLGDIFDFWFDFGSTPPREYLPVLRTLSGVRATGAEIAFMGGNHDHWSRTTRGPGYLEREIGLEILPDPHRLDLNDHRLLLTHGDALGGAIGTYGIVRGVLHHPIAIGAFRALGPGLGRRIARRTSALSRRRHDPARQVGDVEALRERALAMLRDERVDVVVAGHVHCPEHLVTDAGQYVNLGDWIEHRTFAALDDDGIRLETFRH